MKAKYNKYSLRWKAVKDRVHNKYHAGWHVRMSVDGELLPANTAVYVASRTSNHAKALRNQVAALNKIAALRNGETS